MLTSLRFLPVLAYTVLLIVLATAPPIRLPALAAMPTLKWHHVSAFAVYVFLLGWALHAFPRLRTWLRYFITGTVAFSFGVLIEFVQRDIPYRSGQWIDLFPNSLGIVGGLIILAGWEITVRQLRRKRMHRDANENMQKQQPTYSDRST